MLTSRSQHGVVGFNVALVVAFALFAVTQLTRVVIAASQVDDRVNVISTEVGPGSNVSRLDETQKLNETGAHRGGDPRRRGASVRLCRRDRRHGQEHRRHRRRDQRQRRRDQPDGARHREHDRQLLPVVRSINGVEQGLVSGGGVEGIDRRAQAALPIVGGIQVDLSSSNILGTLASVDRHAVAIGNGKALALLVAATPVRLQSALAPRDS